MSGEYTSGMEISEVKSLYYDQRLSVREIAEKLGVSIDAIYGFMRRHHLSRRTNAQQNAVRFEKKRPSFCIRKKLTILEERLKIAGIMLYWGEGFQSEKAHNIDFANCKPRMIRVFLNFLRIICSVDERKLRIYLYAYSNQDIQSIIEFWSKFTGIPKSQFSKPYIRHDFKVEQSGKMKYGLIHVRYYDKKLLQLIKQWIEEYAENCV